MVSRGIIIVKLDIELDIRYRNMFGLGGCVYVWPQEALPASHADPRPASPSYSHPHNTTSYQQYK